MSEQTLQAIHDAVQAHFREIDGDNAVLTDWFVAFAGMCSDDAADSGISHLRGYCASDSSPFAVLGVAQLGVLSLQDDLSFTDDDDDDE